MEENSAPRNQRKGGAIVSTDIFAHALACADAESQAQFINNFSRSLKIVCKGKEQNQLCYIADSLDENGREVIKELQEFSVLSMENRAKTEFEISELYNRKRALEDEIAALESQKNESEVQS